MAADGDAERSSDVNYTIGSVSSSKNLVMVLPANMNMYSTKLTDAQSLYIKHIDSSVKLPNKFVDAGESVTFNIDVVSANGGLFKVGTGTTTTTDVGYNLKVNKTNWEEGNNNARETNDLSTDLRDANKGKTAAVENTAADTRKTYDNNEGPTVEQYKYDLTAEMAVSEKGAWTKVEGSTDQARYVRKIEGLGQKGTVLKDVLTFKLTNVAWK